MNTDILETTTTIIGCRIFMPLRYVGVEAGDSFYMLRKEIAPGIVNDLPTDKRMVRNMKKGPYQ